MTQSEFSGFVESTLEKAIQFAEQMSGRTLPRSMAFLWMGRKEEPIRAGIVEEIVSRVFVNKDHIYPCVDIGVERLLDDGTTLIVLTLQVTRPSRLATTGQVQMGHSFTSWGTLYYIVDVIRPVHHLSNAARMPDRL